MKPKDARIEVTFALRMAQAALRDSAAQADMKAMLGLLMKLCMAYLHIVVVSQT